ncbi:hypothetical protein AMATHDRAFT_153555 [Amanita thiersii Skay4041]|uniref:Glycosyltransferase family 2 protein n=1 Tax=Amanita thiersii Skay4041 TaxID=703135 RepID=A0A2A9N871_9AGAR|nr:hypothetical protein AMATHDRAFT_153555 [Amanita thiersii Skay4041]
MPTLEDFHALSSLLCLLREKGFEINNVVYADKRRKGAQNLTVPGCVLVADFLRHDNKHGNNIVTQKYLEILQTHVDIIIVPKGEFPLISSNQLPKFVIELPRGELEYTGWMGSLSLAEWLNWKTPKIDITVITQNRPHSLTRLLSSLSHGLFYGDTVNVRVNLEQSSDSETLSIIDNFTWIHGVVAVHHRIIHGGLLPAVIESWYPHTNHDFVVLLEDDVELSPLFYGWIKMCVLRYRYGHSRNMSSQLFGISLYQQKHLELPINGRQRFNARSLFLQNDHPFPSTPYLSPVPCSWGAVYFPEHWREFHEYLSIRFSERVMDISRTIVPDVRSNSWAGSWKKYFIEFVFLRGYVMLYPNFDNFTSLSTNHLEVGSHVKHCTTGKKELFLLPLMDLRSTTAHDIGILHLPNRILPHFDSLPVVNLTGALTRMDHLQAVGLARRSELFGCSKEILPFNARSLMCLNNFD